MVKSILKSIFISLILFSLCSLSYAQIPHLINYQGKLTDKDGDPVSDGNYSVTFRIYDAADGGALLWEETQSILIQKGLFSCLLGGVTNLDLAFDKPYWLAIKVGSDSEMTPRQQIASAGYAMRAERAETSSRAASAATADIAIRAQDSDKLGGKSLGEIGFEDLNPELQHMITTGKKTVTGISGSAERRYEWFDLSPEMTFDLLIAEQVEFDLDIELRRTHQTGELSIRLIVNGDAMDTQTQSTGTIFTEVNLNNLANCLQGENTVKVQILYPNIDTQAEARNGILTASW